MERWNGFSRGLPVRDICNIDKELYNADFIPLLDKTPYLILLETCREENDTMITYQISPDGVYLIRPIKAWLINRPLHKHSFIEMMYVLSGSVTHHIEHQTFTYKTGQCCIMNKNIYHCEESSGNYQVVFFIFSDEYLYDLEREYRELSVLSSQVCIDNAIYELIKNIRENTSAYEKTYLDYFPLIGEKEILNEMKPLFNQVVLETLSKEPGRGYFTKGAFARIFHKISTKSLYSMKCEHSQSEGQEYVFGKIKHIMEAAYGRAKREDLAVQLHYSGEYLNRIVKKYTGKTINKYGQEICLKEVRHRLIETDKSINEIIAEFDFSNRTQFYHLFKEAYGETPLEYRKNMRREKEA